MYLLDTDTTSLYLRNQDSVLAQRIEATPPEQLFVSVITVEERLTGWLALARKAKTPELLTFGYEQFAITLIALSRLQIAGFTPSAQARFAVLKSSVKNVGGNDLRIAATALETGATVVTRNVRDFERVPGLTVENWAKPDANR